MQKEDAVSGGNELIDVRGAGLGKRATVNREG